MIRFNIALLLLLLVSYTNENEDIGELNLTTTIETASSTDFKNVLKRQEPAEREDIGELNRTTTIETASSTDFKNVVLMRQEPTEREDIGELNRTTTIETASSTDFKNVVLTRQEPTEREDIGELNRTTTIETASSTDFKNVVLKRQEPDEREIILRAPFSYLATISETGSGKVAATGIIIAKQYVLTSAAIFKKYTSPYPSNYLIRVGIVDDKDQLNKQQTHKVARIAIELKSQFAVLKLVSKLIFSEFISVAPIEVGPYYKIKHKKCSTLRFLKVFNNFKQSETLQGLHEVEVHMLDEDECRKQFKNLEDAQHFCFSLPNGYNEDMCANTAGLPLTCDSRVIGLITNPNAACIVNTPILSSDISRAWSWIKNSMEKDDESDDIIIATKQPSPKHPPFRGNAFRCDIHIIMFAFLALIVLI